MKVLMVEDKYVYVARMAPEAAFADKRGRDPLEEVILATNYEEAMDGLKKATVVYTDICIPGPEGIKNEVIKKTSQYRWAAHTSYWNEELEREEPPLGVLVFLEAKKRGIPVRFGTSLGHGAYILPALLAYNLITEDEVEKIKKIIDPRSRTADIVRVENGIVAANNIEGKKLSFYNELFLQKRYHSLKVTV